MSKISIIMSVYNGEVYLKDSIDSILNQTFADFEFIIVNDGSTDKTASILEAYKDKRIKIINQQNIGLTKSLNKAIRISTGEYIARIDADDIAMPERLKKQLAFLEQHPKTGAIGCWYHLIDKNSKIIKECCPPVKPSKIKMALLYSVPLIHPGLMIRKDVLERINCYDEEFDYAQDKDLIFRIMEHCQLGMVPEFLMKFRYTIQSVTLKHEIEQKECCIKAIKKAIKNGIYPKWCYLFTLNHLISINMPPPVRKFKDIVFNKIGLRHDQK